MQCNGNHDAGKNNPDKGDDDRENFQEFCMRVKVTLSDGDCDDEGMKHGIQS